MQASASAYLCGCQWWSLRAPALTLSISKSARLSQHQKTGSFRSHSHTTGENHAKRWKLVINFSEGSAAALCRWGGQSSNFRVAYYVNVLCAKYCRNWPIYVLCRHRSKMNVGLFLTLTVQFQHIEYVWYVDDLSLLCGHFVTHRLVVLYYMRCIYTAFCSQPRGRFFLYKCKLLDRQSLITLTLFSFLFFWSTV